MSRLRDIGEAIGEQVGDRIGKASSRAQEQRPLPVDLLESDEAYLAVFDAPGAEREDIQIRFDEGTVYVRVDRFREFYEGFEMRIPGRGLALDGSVTLPEEGGAEADGATATLTRTGEIRVEVPKANANSTTIDVENEDDE